MSVLNLFLGEATDPSTRRTGLLLAIPYLLLLASAMVSWPWAQLGLPGRIGTLSPPSILILSFLAVAAFMSMRRRLPLRLFTWGPAGMGAILQLTRETITAGAGQEAAIPGFIASIVIVVFVLFVSVSVGGAGVRYGVLFASLFLMAVASSFPVFATAEQPVANATLWTALAAARSTVEMLFTIAIANRILLKESPDLAGIPFVMLVLVFAHGLFAGWEAPMNLGEQVTLSSIASSFVSWSSLAMILLGPTIVISRLRRQWAQEMPTFRAERQAREAQEQAEQQAKLDQPIAPSEKPSRKRRRRR